jgi:uncharacterized protein (TIGR02246 family)
MKRTIVVSILMGLLVPVGVVKALGQSKDEAAIRKVFADFAEAWGNDDAKAMASFWTEDGDVINRLGRKATGRAEVEKLFAEEHSTNYKGTHVSFAAGTIRFLKPDVAVFTTDFNVPDALTPDGTEVNVNGIVTSVMIRKEGKWVIAAARLVIPPPPPPGQ